MGVSEDSIWTCSVFPYLLFDSACPRVHSRLSFWYMTHVMSWERVQLALSWLKVSMQVVTSKIIGEIKWSAIWYKSRQFSLSYRWPRGDWASNRWLSLKVFFSLEYLAVVNRLKVCLPSYARQQYTSSHLPSARHPQLQPSARPPAAHPLASQPPPIAG